MSAVERAAEVLAEHALRASAVCRCNYMYPSVRLAPRGTRDRDVAAHQAQALAAAGLLIDDAAPVDDEALVDAIAETLAAAMTEQSATGYELARAVLAVPALAARLAATAAPADDDGAHLMPATRPVP